MTIHLLLTGASVRAAADSLAGVSGYALSGADLFLDQDLAAHPYARLAPRYADLPGLVDRWFRELPLDAVPRGWVYTGALENYPQSIAEASRPPWGIPPDTLRQIRDPWQVARVLHDAGVAVPSLAADGSQCDPRSRWLQKPLRSAAGLGIRFWGLFTEPSEPSAADGDCYYQRWICGTPCGGVYLADGANCRLLGVTEQRLTALAEGTEPFHYAGSIGPIDLNNTARAQWQQIGSCLTRAFRLVGLFGVDAVMDGDSAVWPVEVNPRFTASIEVLELAHEAALGMRHAADGRPLRSAATSLLHLHVRLCQGEALPANGVTSVPEASGVAGKWIVYAHRPGVATDSFLDWLTAQSRRAEATAWRVADIPQIGTRFAAGEPVVTVTAWSAASSGVARRRVERCLHQVADDVLRRLPPP